MLKELLKKRLSLLSFICLVACCTNQQSMDYLTNNSSKYWNLVGVKRENNEYIHLKEDKQNLRFDANKTFFKYHITSKGRIPFDYDDVILSNEWKRLGTNILLLNGFDTMKITFISTDSLILIDNTNRMFVYKSVN